MSKINDRPKARTDSRGEETRRRLIEAGLDVFGLYSFEGATTRMLADRAGVNLAAIPYYFDGKEGLYRAVVEHVAAGIGERMLPAVERIDAVLATDDLSRREVLDLLHGLLERFAAMLIGSAEPERWARIIIREQMQPTEAFDILYRSPMRLILDRCAVLVGRLLGRPADDPDIVIRAFTLLGQILVFRMAREAALRTLGCANFDEAQVAAIQAVVREQTERLFAAEPGGAS